MSKILRFRRGKRMRSLRELVRPPFTERMKRLKAQPKRPRWWVMVAGAVVLLGGVVGWVLT